MVKYGDGSLHQVPVMYGDADRQVANIIRGNSENKVNSTPRIAVYVSGLELDKDRISDASFISKVNVRERDVSGNEYTESQGRNYTVERLMPTPFKLTMKVDIWSANTDQKLQILEQILVLFNPSLELQTNSNFVDWTSLTVLNLNATNWSSRTVPVGNDTPIDIATLTLDTPIWISPPVKVKHLGVITRIITSIYEGGGIDNSTYLDGFGPDLSTGGTTLGALLSTDTVTIGGFNIQVYNADVLLLPSTSFTANDKSVPMPPDVVYNWHVLFDQFQYVAGSSQIFLLQPDGSEISGTIAVNELDPTILTVNWNPDTLPSNTGIDSSGHIEGIDAGYNASTSNRPNSPGTFDAIIDPLTYNPTSPTVGMRLLVIDDIGNAGNAVPAAAWGTLVAKTNDIIEWTGSAWHVIFHASQNSDTMLYQTNIYTNIQYLWDGISWNKSFDGDYRAGQWRIVV